MNRLIFLLQILGAGIAGIAVAMLLAGLADWFCEAILNI